MGARSERAVRDRAIWIVRGATFGAVTAAFALTWGFANLAEAYFSGKPPAPPAPPDVPQLATPVQKAPVVIKSVVHHPYQAGSTSGGMAPRPPARGPGAAPAPPPPPACVSTPSKPC